MTPIPPRPHGRGNDDREVYDRHSEHSPYRTHYPTVNARIGARCRNGARSAIPQRNSPAPGTMRASSAGWRRCASTEISGERMSGILCSWMQRELVARESYALHPPSSRTAPPDHRRRVRLHQTHRNGSIAADAPAWGREYCRPPAAASAPVAGSLRDRGRRSRLGASAGRAARQQPEGARMENP